MALGVFMEWFFMDVLFLCFCSSQMQDCGLRKITQSPNVHNHEILGAQHLSFYEKSKFLQSPKGKS